MFRKGTHQAQLEKNKHAYIVIHDDAGNVIVATKQYNAPNNAGQPVFPGGTGKKGSFQRNAEEELQQELGLTLRNGFLVGDDKSSNKGSYQIKNSSTKMKEQYGALFLEVSRTDLMAIASNFRDSLEIASIEVLSTKEATKRFPMADDLSDTRRRTNWFSEIANDIPNPQPGPMSHSIPFWMQHGGASGVIGQDGASPDSASDENPALPPGAVQQLRGQIGHGSASAAPGSSQSEQLLRISKQLSSETVQPESPEHLEGEPEEDISGDDNPSKPRAYAFLQRERERQKEREQARETQEKEQQREAQRRKGGKRDRGPAPGSRNQ